MHLKRVRRCLVVWRYLRVSCSMDALKMHGCKTHFTWKLPLNPRFEWMLRSCLATFYYKALWRSHMAAGACHCSKGQGSKGQGKALLQGRWCVPVLADGCLLALCCAARGFQQRARARRLQGFRDGSKLLSLQRSARFSARLQATASAVNCKTLETAPRLAVVFAQQSSLDLSSECHDLHLASAAGPSSGPSANLSVALFLCVRLL